MIERAIENWLISTNETNYRTAFAQVLLNKCLKVKITHGRLEDGKDIISIDKYGKQYAFQLKTGNITLKKWEEMHSQINDLVMLPIEDPSFDEDEMHYSFLVTNGEIKEHVRKKIHKYNEKVFKKKDFQSLRLYDIHDLLKLFIEAQRNFTPLNLRKFNQFLQFFLADGTDFFKKKEFFSFLDSNFFNEDFRTPVNKAQAISSSIIFTCYLLNPFQLNNNYYALFEAWTSLAASIVRHAKRPLGKKFWTNSFKLTFSEIIKNLKELKKNALSLNGFLVPSLGENEILTRARATIVLGTLAAFENFQHLNQKGYNRDNDFFRLLMKNVDKLIFWGESAFPYYFNLIKFLELYSKENKSLDLLKELFLEVIKRNSPRRNDSFPNPYYDVHDVLENLLKNEMIKNKEINNRFSFLEDPRLNFKEIKNQNIEDIRVGIINAKLKKNFIDESFSFFIDEMGWREIPINQFTGSSYILKSLILMLAKRNQRAIVEEYWHKLSLIDFQEYLPDDPEDFFSWRANKGVNIIEQPSRIQSWNSLVEEVNNLSKNHILLQNLDLMNFFMIISPHRCGPTVIKLLDNHY